MTLTRVSCVLCLVISLFAPGGCFAAEQVGAISGFVIDETTGRLPGAVVELFQPGVTAPIRQALANEMGEFDFRGLPLGVYRLEARLQGFMTVRIDLPKLPPQQSRQVPILLPVGEVVHRCFESDPTVTGVVVDGEVGLSGGLICLADEKGKERCGTTDSVGFFAFELPAVNTRSPSLTVRASCFAQLSRSRKTQTLCGTSFCPSGSEPAVGVACLDLPGSVLKSGYMQIISVRVDKSGRISIPLPYVVSLVSKTESLYFG